MEIKCILYIHSKYIYTNMHTGTLVARQVLLYSVYVCVCVCMRACVRVCVHACVCVCVPVCSSLGVRMVDMKGIHSSNMAAHPSEVLLSLERHCSHH